MELPVYLFTGMLESGKSTLVQEVVTEEDFLMPGKTLLIQCEEGEVEFSQEFLDKYDIELINVEEPDELNEDFWRTCEFKYRPRQIMIEYNGMWEMDMIFESGIPDEWLIGGIYSTVNGETADLYMNNMRKMFMEPLRDSNLIIVNRCSEDIDRQKFRRAFKALNPPVQVVFEGLDGELFENEKEVLPFDYNGDTIELEDMDYGLWYVDAMDTPGRYMGKEITFTARYCESEEEDKTYFVPGRHVMTCCEDDIQFLGFLCYTDRPLDFEHGQWVRVKVQFFYGECEMYGEGEEGPILHMVEIDACEAPEQELVTFT